MTSLIEKTQETSTVDKTQIKTHPPQHTVFILAAYKTLQYITQNKILYMQNGPQSK